MGLDSILNISITNTTVSVSQQGFGVPLVLGYHTRFPERYRVYSSLAAMTADGFVTTDMEYKAVSAIFAQNPKPPKVIVGRRLTRSTQTVELTPIAVNNAVYKVTLNGTTYTYTADGTATVAEITAGLTSLINADGPLTVTAADNTTKLTLVGDSFAQFTIEVSVTNNGELRQQDITTDAGWATDLGDLLTASKDWYAVIMTSKGKAEVIAAAAWVESNKRLLIASSADYDMTSGSTTDLASSLKNSGYARTSVMFHHAPEQYADAAWAGKLLPNEPGSATWAYKALAGISASDLSDSSITNLESKRANYYIALGGVNVTLQGKVSSNEWLDVVIGIDWLKARLQERIYGRLVALKKVPYTETGIALVSAEIRAQLLEGVNNGLLVQGSELVAFPPIASISNTDKNNRLLPSGTFSAKLAGAIHSVNITGTVSV